MARFLIAVWPFRSHYSPLLAVAHALRERGHRVGFYTGAGALPSIESAEFDAFPFVKVDEGRIQELMFTGRRYASWRAPFRLKTLLREWLLGTVPAQVEDLDRISAEWRPDAIVSETSMWAPMLVLHEARAIPVAVFSTVAACMLPGPDAPPFGLGLPRARSRVRSFLYEIARAAGDRFSADFRREANAVRARYRLGPLPDSVAEHTGRMPLYLVPSTAEFDYNRRDLPPSVHYVGPCVWKEPGREPKPEWMEELARRPDRACVHVTEGTMHTEEPFLLRAAGRGLAHLPMQVVLTTGGHRDPDELDLGLTAENVRVEKWVSHADLLPLTDVVVTTGGAGTVMAVLQEGIPLVVVPTEWDKPEMARRVAEAGAGISIPPRRCTPEKLRDAVRKVLSESSFRENAERLKADFSRYSGPERAAELLETLGEPGPERRSGSA